MIIKMFLWTYLTSKTFYQGKPPRRQLDIRRTNRQVSPVSTAPQINVLENNVNPRQEPSVTWREPRIAPAPALATTRAAPSAGLRPDPDAAAEG